MLLQSFYNFPIVIFTATKLASTVRAQAYLLCPPPHRVGRQIVDACRC